MSMARRALARRSCPQQSIMAATTASSFHSTTRRFDEHETTTTEKEVTSLPPWRDPAMRQYMFWNRETSTDRGKYFDLLEMSPESIVREARIASLSAPVDPANDRLHHGPLPPGASLVAMGETVDDLQRQLLTKTSNNNDNNNSSATGKTTKNQQQPNVLFVSPSCPHAAKVLPQVLQAFPSIEWVHCRSAGIDFIESGNLAQMFQTTTTTKDSNNNPKTNHTIITNAKGQFSSSLAEYALFACSYFAKNLPRLLRQQSNKEWIPYNVEELRGKTLGIVGYGDIGRACAKLGTQYGMRITALRRHPFLSRDDPFCNKVYDRSAASLQNLMSESDYIVCSAPSTVETRGMVNAPAFDAVKPGAVFINLGRGPVVDEDALLRALQHDTGNLKGAALDVFAQEPLPRDHPLWELPNVLISPHNMDQTTTFMHEATEFFVHENLPRFLCGQDLLNPVDPCLGY